MSHEVDIREVVLYGLNADARETMAEELCRGIAESVALGLTSASGNTERDVVDAGTFSLSGGSARDLTAGIAGAVARAVGGIVPGGSEQR